MVSYVATVEVIEIFSEIIQFYLITEALLPYSTSKILYLDSGRWNEFVETRRNS